jgi:hypothetical protein
MKKKVIIIDTSVLCVWLQLPGKETAGKDNSITYELVENYIKEETGKGATLVLPLTSIIETGNFVAQIEHNRDVLGAKLADVIIAAANGTAPWVAFSQQGELWTNEALVNLANCWRKTVVSEKQSIGDAAIVDVAEYYAKSPLFEVVIFTGDGGLKNHEYRIAGRKQKTLRRNR